MVTVYQMPLGKRLDRQQSWFWCCKGTNPNTVA